MGCRFSGAMSSRRGTAPSGVACGVSLSSHWAGPTNTGGGALSCLQALPSCPWDAALYRRLAVLGGRLSALVASG